MTIKRRIDRNIYEIWNVCCYLQAKLPQWAVTSSTQHWKWYVRRAITVVCLVYKNQTKQHYITVHALSAFETTCKYEIIIRPTWLRKVSYTRIHLQGSINTSHASVFYSVVIKIILFILRQKNNIHTSSASCRAHDPGFRLIGSLYVAFYCTACCYVVWWHMSDFLYSCVRVARSLADCRLKRCPTQHNANVRHGLRYPHQDWCCACLVIGYCLWHYSGIIRNRSSEE